MKQCEIFCSEQKNVWSSPSTAAHNKLSNVLQTWNESCRTQPEACIYVHFAVAVWILVGLMCSSCLFTILGTDSGLVFGWSDVLSTFSGSISRHTILLSFALKNYEKTLWNLWQLYFGLQLARGIAMRIAHPLSLDSWFSTDSASFAPILTTWIRDKINRKSFSSDVIWYKIPGSKSSRRT